MGCKLRLKTLHKQKVTWINSYIVGCKSVQHTAGSSCHTELIVT